MGVPLPVSLPPVTAPVSVPSGISSGIISGADVSAQTDNAGFEEILNLALVPNDLGAQLLPKNSNPALTVSPALDAGHEKNAPSAVPVFQRGGLGSFNARFAVPAKTDILPAPAVEPVDAKQTSLVTRLGGAGLLGNLSSSVLALLGGAEKPVAAENTALDISVESLAANIPAVVAVPVVAIPQPVLPAVPQEPIDTGLALDGLSRRALSANSTQNNEVSPNSLFERFAAKVSGETPTAFINSLEAPLKTEIAPQLVVTPSGNNLTLVSLSIESAAPPKTISHSAVPIDRLHEVLVREAHSASPDATREFTIRLDPASLGRIDVKLEVKSDGYVTAVIQAEQSSTFDLLRQNARGFDLSLTESGLKTDQNSLAFAWRDNSDRHAFQQTAPDADTDSAGEKLAPISIQPQRRWLPFLSPSRVDVSA